MTDTIQLPPQNIEAEQAVLGAILLNTEALGRAGAILSGADFYWHKHQRIFQAMEGLNDRGVPIDSLSLSDWLKASGWLEEVGGRGYLAELLVATPSSANIAHHARLVREKSVARRLAGISQDVLTHVYEDRGSLSQLLETTEQQIFALAHPSQNSAFVKLTPVLHDAMDYVEKVSKHATHLTGIASGFTDVDAVTAGWQDSDLIVIAGRPSMGKTSLSMSAAKYAAVELKKTVGVFSLEMSSRQLGLRMLGAEARVDTNALRTGRLTPSDWHKLAAAMQRLSNAKLFIDDAGFLTVAQLRGKARRLKAEHGLDLLIVDYLQLLQGPSSAESRQQEVSDISRTLKQLAKELNIPVIALSQLSRAVESRKPPIPMLADLRESGAIEQDADLVMFLYREEIYDKDSPKRGIAEVLIKKHRNGPIRDVELVFVDQLAKFENKALVSASHDEPQED